jgi:Phage integrase family
MVRVNLKGIAKVTAKGRTYWYAWRGGPRLRGEPGDAEFVRSFREAHESLRAPDTSRFRSLVVLYKSSDEYEKLAASTKRNWAPWLDRIGDYFGDLQVAQFDRPEKIRPVIRQWRNRWADKPRTADYALQVLSRVLSYAVDPLGRIAGNPCEGIKQLYCGDRSEVIWADADIAQLKKTCSAEITWAVDLASRRRPWTVDGFGSSFNKAKIDAGLAESDLHFHDLRGTAATRFYTAGLPERVIAEIMGWEEEHVARIIRRYMGRSAATKAIIQQLNKSGR